MQKLAMPPLAKSPAAEWFRTTENKVRKENAGHNINGRLYSVQKFTSFRASLAVFEMQW